jgi:hypothetical protein
MREHAMTLVTQPATTGLAAIRAVEGDRPQSLTAVRAVTNHGEDSVVEKDNAEWDP